jgi:hypothetical protein
MQQTTKLEEIDFKRSDSGGWLTLVLTLLFYLPGPLILWSFLLKDIRTDPARLRASAPYILGVAAAYLGGLALILFYGVFDAFRYRLSDDGLRVRGLTGWRLTRWGEVSQASIVSNRGIYLVLFTSKRSFVRFPLGNYGRMKSLVDEVSKRTSAPIEIPQHLAPHIGDR